MTLSNERLDLEASARVFRDELVPNIRQLIATIADVDDPVLRRICIDFFAAASASAAKKIRRGQAPDIQAAAEVAFKKIDRHIAQQAQTGSSSTE